MFLRWEISIDRYRYRYISFCLVYTHIYLWMRSNRKKKVEERGVEKRRKVLEKARAKRIDVNSRDEWNRPMESRRKIKQIFRDGQR